ncbi:MAG: hypothetical protein LAN71_07905 [Acidobacteriia bacterium]|nr:hypothetical protein [Terriglobia bacterium]
MTSNPSNLSSAPHCHHRFPTGRRCRLPIADPDSNFCLRHAFRRKQAEDDARLAAALTRQSDGFQTAAGIHKSLSHLYRNLADNRISPRRAAVLAYISNLLLRTLPAIEQELDPDAASGAPTIIWDIPRPPRDPLENQRQEQDAGLESGAPGETEKKSSAANRGTR